MAACQYCFLARDFLSDHGPTRIIEIETRREQSRVAVDVRDRGHGIPPERLASVFDRFFSTKSDGLGMGLAICRRIIGDHDGQIEASNLEGGGAIFRFSLPAANGGS